MKSSFRNGVYAGLLLAAVLGLYLYQLWQPARQVQLHSEHLAGALEDQDWAEVEEFLAPNYEDQWGHDRPLVVSRLRAVLSYARNLRLVISQPMTIAADGSGKWTAHVRVEADENEVLAFIKGYVNKLEEPFELQWRQRSRKPWDWQLVRVSNPALELPANAF